MEKRALLFLDYNETFDDVCEDKGNIFFAALKRFVKHFDGNVEIAVITSAYDIFGNEEQSIKYDLLYTMTLFPQELKSLFKYLIEGNSMYLTKIDVEGKDIRLEQPQTLSLSFGKKDDGVELALKTIDPQHKITTCVFAGNDEYADLKMMDADVEGREKYFILANRRILKTEKYPVYRLSMKMPTQQFNYGKQIIENFENPVTQMIVKTSDKSFGVGKGLEVVTSLLEEKERLK